MGRVVVDQQLEKRGSGRSRELDAIRRIQHQQAWRPRLTADRAFDMPRQSGLTQPSGGVEHYSPTEDPHRGPRMERAPQLTRLRNGVFRKVFRTSRPRSSADRAAAS